MSERQTPEDVRPRPTLAWMARRLGNHTYEGGVNGTCYLCPFASPPLDRFGDLAEWRDISNDPTEAYFRCSLPTRGEHKEVEWGEYANCTTSEWADEIARRLEAHPRVDDQLLDAFIENQRTRDGLNRDGEPS